MIDFFVQNARKPEHERFRTPFRGREKHSGVVKPVPIGFQMLITSLKNDLLVSMPQQKFSKQYQLFP